MDLEIRHLRLVAGIADAGTMTAAADRLCLTQSALSHQLRDIERRVGNPFFVRLGRRMVLTAAGRRVLDTARRVIGEVERAEDDLRRLAGRTDGSIRVRGSDMDNRPSPNRWSSELRIILRESPGGD